MKSDKDKQGAKISPQTSSRSPYTIFILITGIITGLISGFILGVVGTYYSLILTVRKETLEFFYGMAYVLMGGGIIGACVGGILSGIAFHYLAKSRFGYYAHYIAAIIFFVVFIMAMWIFFVGG